MQNLLNAGPFFRKNIGFSLRTDEFLKDLLEFNLKCQKNLGIIHFLNKCQKYFKLKTFQQ